MRGQIGHWGDALDFGLTPEMVAWAAGRKLSLHLELIEPSRAERLANSSAPMRRVLRLVAGAEGHAITSCGVTMALPHHVRFGYSTFQAARDLLQAPRFRLHEVTFHRDGDSVWTELDPNHLLPWPKLVDCKLYDVPEVLHRDLSLRLRSALTHGGKSFGAPMPDGLRDRMPPGTYKAALAAARAELDAEKAEAMERLLAA
jgi:hypothetical protein